LGRKVHPVGFRLGIIKDWQSRWFAERNYTELLQEDIKLRALVAKRLANASISRVDLERSAANQIEITLSTAKPGIVIGKGGQAVEVLRKEFETMTGKKVKLNINEIKQPELDAYLVAESIADQITRRVSYKRAMKQAIQRATRLGAKGVRIRLSGRLGGAEMARVVGEREGRVPLHTIRADIDYGQVHAHTTYGRVGVKVWIYRGDVIGMPGTSELGQGDFGRGHEGGPRPPRPDRPGFDSGPRPPRPAGPPPPQQRSPRPPARPAAEAPAAPATTPPAGPPAIAAPAPPAAAEPAAVYAAGETTTASGAQAPDPGLAAPAPAPTETAGTGSVAVASTETSTPAAGTPSADEAAPDGEGS